jgi:hypothetical protein
MKMFRMFIKGEMRKLCQLVGNDEKNQNHTERRKLAKATRKVVSEQMTDIGQKNRNSIKKHIVKIYKYMMAVC